MTKVKGIDHWYQLHVKNWGGGHALPETVIEGPIPFDQMFRRFQEIIDCAPKTAGYLAHGALGVRVDVNSVDTYLWKRSEWVLQKRSKSLPSVDAKLCEQVENGARVLMLGERQRNVTLQFGGDGQLCSISESQQMARELLLRPLGYAEHLENKVTIVNVTASIEYNVGVDLNLLTSRANGKRARSISIPNETEAYFHPDVYKSYAQPSDDAEPAVKPGPPILGFRSWILNLPSRVVDREIWDQEPQLFGPMFSERSEMYQWRDAEKIAECSHVVHKAPADGCSCGIYAYHGPVVGGDTNLNVSLLSKACYVEGAILGTGDVMVYDHGWRAETARIIGFADNVAPEFLPALHDVAAKFDVPVLSPGRLYEMALTKGRIITKEELD